MSCSLAVGSFGSIVGFESGTRHLERYSFYGGFGLHVSGQDLLSFFPEYDGVNFVQIRTGLHA